MNQAAKVLDFEEAQGRRLLPEAHGRIQGNGRAIAVGKLRELADKLESGELDGCRAEWRDDRLAESQMITVTIERPNKRPSRTARFNDAGGSVQVTITTIEEV